MLTKEVKVVNLTQGSLLEVDNVEYRIEISEDNKPILVPVSKEEGEDDITKRVNRSFKVLLTYYYMLNDILRVFSNLRVNSMIDTELKEAIDKYQACILANKEIEDILIKEAGLVNKKE